MASNASRGLFFEQLALDLEARLTPDREDSLYAAGFTDGEGCISVNRYPGSGTFRAQIVIQVTTLPVLEWLRDRWGGKIYAANPAGVRRRQQSWQWAINRDQQQLDFLMDVRPFLKVKGEVVDNALAFLRLKMAGGWRRSEADNAALLELVVVHRQFGVERERRRLALASEWDAKHAESKTEAV